MNPIAPYNDENLFITNERIFVVIKRVKRFSFLDDHNDAAAAAVAAAAVTVPDDDDNNNHDNDNDNDNDGVNFVFFCFLR